MNATVEDLRGTIIPKSDQLNAEQLLNGDLTITVSDVRMGTDDQPVVIHYDGEEGHPYKPAKTMRKLLIFAWGEDGRQWIGKSMTLYNDQAVRFGGMVVGGIRISHMSHIEREISLSLTATKGKKAQHTILPLEVVTLADVLKDIAAASDRNSLNAAKVVAMKLTTEHDVTAAQDAFNTRVKELKSSSTKRQPEQSQAVSNYDTVMANIKGATDLDALDTVMDSTRDFEGDQAEELAEAYRLRRVELS
jgi:hypothetical protein